MNTIANVKKHHPVLFQCSASGDGKTDGEAGLGLHGRKAPRWSAHTGVGEWLSMWRGYLTLPPSQLHQQLPALTRRETGKPPASVILIQTNPPWLAHSSSSWSGLDTDVARRKRPPRFNCEKERGGNQRHFQDCWDPETGSWVDLGMQQAFSPEFLVSISNLMNDK